jgi:hypothetical protein
MPITAVNVVTTRSFKTKHDLHNFKFSVRRRYAVTCLTFSFSLNLDPFDMQLQFQNRENLEHSFLSMQKNTIISPVNTFRSSQC